MDYRLTAWWRQAKVAKFPEVPGKAETFHSREVEQRIPARIYPSGCGRGHLASRPETEISYLGRFSPSDPAPRMVGKGRDHEQ